MVQLRSQTRLGHITAVVVGMVREHVVKRVARSSRWARVRREHLRANPSCAACRNPHRLQVHHIVPFEDRPDLELDPSNLITLCMGFYECHLHVGHGGDYRFFNPHVVLSAKDIYDDPTLRGQVELEAMIYRKDHP